MFGMAGIATAAPWHVQGTFKPQARMTPERSRLIPRG